MDRNPPNAADIASAKADSTERALRRLCERLGIDWKEIADKPAGTTLEDACKPLADVYAEHMKGATRIP